MEFFKNIGRSIYSPKYYQELVKKPFSYSVKYIFLFVLVLGVLKLCFLAFYIPEFHKNLSSFSSEAKEIYPEELEVFIKDGNVSTNVEEPYFVPLPDLPEEGGEEVERPENLIVIDTGVEPSVENLEGYDSMILVTRNYIVSQNNRGKIEMQSLQQVPDMTINKSMVIKNVDEYSPYLNLFYPLIIIGILLGAFFFVIIRFAYLFFGALLVWLIARIKKVDIEYGKAYQMGIHLMTLPLLVSFLTTLKFSFSFTILLLILAVVNIRKESEAEVKEGAEETKEIESTEQSL